MAAKQSSKGKHFSVAVDLSELEWTGALISAGGGHPERLLRLLKDQLPGEAYEYVSALIKTSTRKSPGQRARVDWQDAIVIRARLGHHDLIMRRFGHDPRVRKAYGTKHELRAAMAKEHGCSEGTIRDIEARRGVYAEKAR